MKNYKRIILAVELLAKSDRRLIEHAQYLVHDFKADVILVHAVPHEGMYVEENLEIEFEMQDALLRDATSKMQELSKSLNIPGKHQVVEKGLAKTVILEAAAKHKADLIMIGSHGRHGLQLLLGSTANAVLHEAKCDVLAVRLKE